MPGKPAAGSAFAIALLALAAAASAQSDNFDDGVRGPQWSLVVDQPAVLDLAETGGSLSITGQAGGVASNDALYLSNGAAGFRLSTAADFAIRLGYDFSAVQSSAGAGSQLGLVFGVGRDLAGTDSAAVAYAIGDTGAGLIGGLGFAWRTDGVQTSGVPDFSRPAAGTFFVTWDAEIDRLSLGDGTKTYLLYNTVLAEWGADALFISLGGRGAGLETLAGDATLDDFVITSGQIVAVPEPAVGLPLLAGLMLLRRSRARHSIRPTTSRS
jgi:hypothetical protein